MLDLALIAKQTAMIKDHNHEAMIMTNSDVDVGRHV